jgi:Casein kinase substrate phosphoprotein PP28.
VKKNKKLSTLNEVVKGPTTAPELSRREREEIEAQKATAHYQKLHAEGKTEQARADLARLAIIKQQRAEAAKRREEEKRSEYSKLVSA